MFADNTYKPILVNNTYGFMFTNNIYEFIFMDKTITNNNIIHY